MPIQFTWDAARAILFTTAEGMVTLTDIITHLDCESDAALLGCPEIFDARDARTNLTPNDVRNLVGQIQMRMKGTQFGPTAVVTTNDVFFGMARMMEILAELDGGPAFGVFRTLDDALQWLLCGTQPDRALAGAEAVDRVITCGLRPAPLEPGAPVSLRAPAEAPSSAAHSDE